MPGPTPEEASHQITTQLSLAYLMNPVYSGAAPTVKPESSSPSTEDLHFYRRRISALNKQLLKTGYRPSTDADVAAAHEAFVAAAVRHFRMIDTHDHVQDAIGERAEASRDMGKSVGEAGTSGNPEAESIPTNADALMYSAPKRVTLDNFVKRVGRSKPRRIVPRASLNLGDEALRSKGLKSKAAQGLKSKAAKGLKSKQKKEKV